MSKSLSSIHTARSRWSGTSFSFQRNFGTRGIRSRSVRRTSSKLNRSDSAGSTTVSPPTCWCHAGVSVDRKSASVPDKPLHAGPPRDVGQVERIETPAVPGAP